MTHEKERKPGAATGSLIGVWMGIGAGVGVALGTAAGNLAVGIAVGVALGAGVGSALEKATRGKFPAEQEGKRQAAVLIATGLLLVVGLVLLLSFMKAG